MSQPVDLIEELYDWVEFPKGELDVLLERAAEEIRSLRSEVAELRTANAIWEQTEMRPPS